MTHPTMTAPRIPLDPAIINCGDFVVRRFDSMDSVDGYYALRIVRILFNGALMMPRPQVDGGDGNCWRTPPLIILASDDGPHHAGDWPLDSPELFHATQADIDAYYARQRAEQAWIASALRKGARMSAALAAGEHEADRHI